MAILETTIQETVCDVCGKKADGQYFTVGHLNGDIYFETSCPLDLCKEHMELFASKYSYLEYERGSDDFEEKKQQLLDIFKND